MTRAELELHCIRTSIEAYSNILKNENDLSEDKILEIREKIRLLSKYRDELLRETNNYGL